MKDIQISVYGRGEHDSYQKFDLGVDVDGASFTTQLRVKRDQKVQTSVQLDEVGDTTGAEPDAYAWSQMPAEVFELVYNALDTREHTRSALARLDQWWEAGGKGYRK